MFILRSSSINPYDGASHEGGLLGTKKSHRRCHFFGLTKTPNRHMVVEVFLQGLWVFLLELGKMTPLDMNYSRSHRREDNIMLGDLATDRLHVGIKSAL